MKPLLPLIILACPLHAELLATFHTTRGNVVVDLQYNSAPQTVANFLTLADGSRPWVDSFTGRVRNEPFYNGTKIHRTSDDANFKFAQGGSPKGDGSDGPGYTIKDEFSPSLTHVPYVLSAANAGPNTVGSQFFFTGTLPQPSYDNVHTIFGWVTDPASRTIVDEIITAGANATTINEITFERTDLAAEAFDEHAQNLPVVSQSGGSLIVNRGVSAIWQLNPLISTGDIFRAFRSNTLAPGTWVELASAYQHVGIGSAMLTPVSLSAYLDDAAADKAFYYLSVAKHPGAVAPADTADRTILIEVGDNLFSYQFNSSGAGGIATIIPMAGENFTFSFSTLDLKTSAHNITLVVENVGLLPQFKYFLIKVGCDSATTNQIDGRHVTNTYGSFGWQPFSSGLAAISR